MIGATVAGLLMAAQAEGTGGGADGKLVANDGTMITEGMKKLALEAIHAAWDIQDKVTNVSKMVLDLAKQAVKAANGDLPVALKKFGAAIQEAEAALLEEHGKTKAGKAKVEAIIATGSIWKQYTSNIGAGLKDGFDPAPYKTESAYRTARQNAKKASRTVQDLRSKVGDVLNIAELSDTDLLEYAKDHENQTDAIIEALREDGYEDAVVDPEKEKARVHSQSETDAAKYFRGIETAIMKPREALATIMRTCRAIDWNGEHNEDATRELSNCLTKLLKFVPKEQAPQRSRATPPAQQQNVQTL
jgi:hypothetical protein